MKKWTMALFLLIALVQSGFGQSVVKVADVLGVWQGIHHNFGQDSHLIYKIRLRDDGSLTASHDAPDFSLNDIPVSEVKLEGDRLTIKIGLYEGIFEGTVGRDVIHGYYGTSAFRTPLTLWRASPDPHFLLANMAPRLDDKGRPVFNYRYMPPRQGDDAWEVADAAAMKLDTGRIGLLMKRVLAGDFPNLHSIVMVKDEKLIVDEYFYGFDRDKPHRLSSVAKAVVASVIGTLLQQGQIRDVHTPLCELFPQYADLLCTGEKKRLTLYHLLTMTTGLRWSEHAVSYFDPTNDLIILRSSPDPLRNLFERPLTSQPGERFVYNSACSIALETIIQNITKMHFLVSAQKDLFTPMMISNIRWDYSEGLYMTPRDMAKLGWLFLHKGEFKGMRILSEAWADSATSRFERDHPRYFNHWWPIVYFVNDMPVQALQAGGWGGQSITIFPSLNTTIVLTAANQLLPADYDVCIRDYLLPAILTPEYLAAHPDAEYHGIHRTRNLEWEMRWDTEMGCIRAATHALGRPLTDAQLYGGTGVGFLINIDERAEAKSMAVWNWHGAYDLCRNLGFSIESIWSHNSNPDFAAMQKLVWDRVRQSIDSGYVCYGFNLDNPIRTLIIGYDKIGYYYRGWEAENGKGPEYWNELGMTDIGLLGMHFVRPVSHDIPYRDMFKSALQFVLNFSANDRRWVPTDCQAGPEGYGRWISLLESGKEDGYGVSYIAAELAEGRRYAVRFLEEARSRLGGPIDPLFVAAIAPYQRSAIALEKMTLIFPHGVSTQQRNTNLQDAKKRRDAIQCLRAAREAEIQGLEALKQLSERLN